MIEVKNLTKHYGTNLAVDNISFTVEDGKIYGFLGPNGAGKSTTMNMITGCLSIEEGEVLINGYDIFKEPEKAKKCIGYLPEIPPLYTDMTPYEYLVFIAGAKGVKKAKIKESVLSAIEKTGIMHMKDRLIKNLSKGYRQRVGIAQAIVSNPDIIILDEPTVGLDPLQIIEIRNLIKELGKEHTVILSSHILSEIRAVCDSVIIIDKGKICASDTLENLENTINDNFTIKCEVKGSVSDISACLSSLNIDTQLNESENIVSFEICTKEDIRESVFFAFADKKLPIISMTAVKSDIEDIFIQLTEEKEDNNESDLS